MHTVHAGGSFVISLSKLKDEDICTMKSILKSWDHISQCSNSVFSQLKSTIFIKGIVIPKQIYNNNDELPPTLLIFTSFCGPFKTHLHELVCFYGAELRNLFQHCKQFPQQAMICDKSLKKFLSKHRRPDTFYTGMQCITNDDIYREELLRKEIEKYIVVNYGVLSLLSPLNVVANIKKHINGIGSFNWIFDKCEKNFHDKFVLYGKGIAYSVAILLIVLFVIFGPSVFAGNDHVKTARNIILAIFAAFIIFIAIMIRYSEQQQDKLATRPCDLELNKIASAQIYPVVNEMTAAGPLKKGWFRRVAFWFVLRVVSVARGKLNIPTIATARWLSIDKGKRLVFVSNFTNLTEFYIRDFIDNRSSARMINVIFGNGSGFPGTKWFFQKGVMDDPQAFMNSVFQTQHLAQFWYWPHKNLSIENINNNRKIRQGVVAKEMTEEEAQEWLHRIR